MDLKFHNIVNRLSIIKAKKILFIILVLLNLYTILLSMYGAYLGFKVVDISSHLNYLQSSINQIIHFIKFNDILPTSEDSLYFIPNSNYFDDKGNSIYILSHTIYSIFFNKSLGVAEYNRSSLAVLHFVIFMFYILALAIIYIYARNNGNRKLDSLIAVSFLNLWPYIYGNMFINVRDTAVAIGYIMFLVGLLNSFQKIYNNWKNNIIIVIGLILSVGTRIGFILIIFITLFIFSILLVMKINENKKILINWFSSFCIAIILVFISNPQLWDEPLNTLKKILITSSNFNQWGGDLIANGQFFDGDRAPWWYQTSYLFNQIPVGYIFIFIFLGILFIINYKNYINKNTLFLVTFLFILPFGYTILSKPTVYSGIRQIFFVLPLITIIFINIYKPIKFKTKNLLNFLIIIYFCFIILLDYKKFPLNYVYYNEFNINQKIDLKWDLDYQGISQEILQRKYLHYNPKIHPEGFVNELNFENGNYGYDLIKNKQYLIKYRDINLPWFNNDCESIDSINRNFYFSKVTFAEIRKCHSIDFVDQKKYKLIPLNNGTHEYNITLNEFVRFTKKNIGNSICISGIVKVKNKKLGEIDVKNFKLHREDQFSTIFSANRYSFIENQETGRSNGLVLKTKIMNDQPSRFVACFDHEKVKLEPNRKYKINYLSNEIAEFRT